MGMPIHCLLLRLFLSLALILNGMSAAMASAHLPGAAMIEAAKAEQEPGVPPCHQSAQETPMAHGEEADMADATQAGHPSDKDGKSGCCESGLCRCTCVHGSHVAVTALPPIATAHLPHAVAVRSLSPAHATPALPHLIRPPIG